MNAKTSMLAVLLSSAMICAADEYAEQHREVPYLHYHDDFKEYYPKLSHRHDLKGLPLAKPVVVVDALRQIKATVVQTDTGKISYGSSLSNVTIEGVGVEPVHVSVKGFRKIDAHWVGSNLLYLSIDIGHVAAVECVLDVREKKWVYQRSLSYNKFSELKLPPEDTDKK